jgi:superfamily II RNA helicase
VTDETQTSNRGARAIQIPEGEAPLDYLAFTLPPRDLGPDDVLDAFLRYVELLALELYPAQEEAILEVLAGRNVILNTPTGSGKSLVATALHFDALARDERSFYAAPIKALVNEKFFALCRDFGAKHVGLMTGDASVNADAPIICCTTEILASIGLREGRHADVDHAVIDEFHYYSDRERGVAWQVPLLTLPQTRFLLMSATFGDPSPFEERLTRLTGLGTAVVTSRDRPVPLDFEYRETPLHETLLHLVKEEKVPAYVVHFTQRGCAEEAQNLMSTDYCTKAEKQAIALALRGARFDSAYGREIQRYLRHGIGIHHAGLLPKYRLLCEKLAQRGHLKIIVGTDTLGVGVNIPIRTVVFTKLCKYDGNRTALLTARDFHQISGRAGRRGFDTKGSVVAQAPEHVVENLRLEAKAGSDKAKQRKLVKRKPPERGYVHWDRAVFERLMQSPPEALVSRFRVTHDMVLNVLQREQGGCRSLARIIRDCHESKRNKRMLGREAVTVFQSLLEAGVIEVTEERRIVLHADLQQDFSLFRTLSLYLVDAIELLDRDLETYALDLLSVVESILENPDVVLFRQLDKLKGEKVAELKAAGVEYEERMEELEKLTYPKPNADFAYDTFNAFAKQHPWVASENIRPKSIAREMYETFSSFVDYIRDYGLERSEGVLLRYLSEVYKTLVQTVPLSARTEEVEDMITFFGAMLRSVDSSLIEEWERMLEGAPPRARYEEDESVLVDADRVDITRDARGFQVLVRNRLFSLLKALSRREWDTASSLLDSDAEPWTAQRYENALAPFYAEHSAIRLDPPARAPANTRIVAQEGEIWRIEQTICDPEGDNEFFLLCRLDLTRSRDAGYPVLALDGVSG